MGARAAMFKVTTTLQMVKLTALSKGVGKAADHGVDAWAKALAEDARAVAHVITGAMAASIGSSTGQRVAISCGTSRLGGATIGCAPSFCTPPTR